MRDFTVRSFRQFATGGLAAIPSRAVDEATGAVTNTAPGVPLSTSWIPPPDASVRRTVPYAVWRDPAYLLHGPAVADVIFSRRSVTLADYAFG